ncbi:hypothetical protein [Wukongibacter sp. M2B1]|uniref:hypothetical protein n=1 Tax=Wukongibacter sp. M2B1 TaxID=3088895 RepID=UPI003D7BD8F0
MNRVIIVGKIIFVMAFAFILLGVSSESMASSVEKIDVLDETINEMDNKDQIDKVTEKALFSHELDKSYNLYVVNDSTYSEYENILILKKVNDKMKKIGEFRFEPQKHYIEGTEIYKISKIAVQQSKPNDTVDIYVYREGQNYEGFDILVLGNETIDKKWIYRNKQNPNLMFGHYGEYKDIFNQQRSYIYEGKRKKNQNIKQDLKEEKKLINEFTQRLEKIQGRKIMYGDFLDDNHYVYVVTDQIDKQNEKILIVSLNDGMVNPQFEGGDLAGDGQPIKQIHKISINRLNNTENPNICVFRKNEEYTKVQMIEVNKNKNAIHYMGSCKQDNETGEYMGNENYKYVMDFSFLSDYSNE